MGITEQLARMALETAAERFAGPIMASARLRILDTIGIAIAGSREHSTRIALEAVRHQGGNGHASVIAHPDRTASPLAGFVNGVAAHSQEYDDFTKGVTHVSVVMVPGVLAIAEELGASGKDMLAGFIVGFEVDARLARGMRPALFDRGWHPNGIVGAMGVAAAAARMMGLDTWQTRMALGIAASEAQGLRKNVGSMGKAFHIGHGIRNGIFAAQLASRGFEVDPDIVESGDSSVGGHERFGLAATFCGSGDYTLARATENIGEQWELGRDTTIVCFHPGSTAPAASIDAVLDLTLAHDLRPEQVERIELECTTQAQTNACYTEAADPYRARYCLPWSIAVALIDRCSGLAQYTQERIDRGDVQALMGRIDVRVPADLAHHRGQWEHAVNWGEMRIAVHLKDGRVLRHARSHARGWSEEPATWDDIAQKYTGCCEGIFGPGQRDETLAMIREIEALPNIRELMAALRARR
ncbi:MAG: MmgE/PrpD family protein [Burkholderiales bacterium]|nr:MmgE/PrpD family protein [Burkholderiales bacterium]